MLGPNGAGKSTAISLLLGLQQADSGTATLFGRSPSDIEARYGVGVMMQEVTLAVEMSVRQLITLTTSYYPAPMTADEAMALTHTTELADRPYGKLSAGQKRQVQFALAVCGRPSLLFLDEPTVGLDVQARETLWTTIRQLLAQGASIVLTTHYLEEAEALASRVAVLAKGRLVAMGTVDDIRGVVSRKRVSCLSALPPERRGGVGRRRPRHPRRRPPAHRARDADDVVRRLLAADAHALRPRSAAGRPGRSVHRDHPGGCVMTTIALTSSRPARRRPPTRCPCGACSAPMWPRRGSKRCGT